ncbi:ribulose-phosphate 3-epimerase [Candidatus Poribacteria bacterium]|nr:ribulose-phosphate 3-epimerase [Candidatus Poribacteria bacterium]
MNNNRADTPKIAPSLLAADFSCFGDEVQRVTDAGADLLHFDVMDGALVPNFGISPPLIASVRDKTELVFDVHIMVTHPLSYIEALIDAGSDIITFHIESHDDPNLVIEAIKKHNVSAGIAYSPNTKTEAIIPFLSSIDLILPMSVEPGFGGQSFLTNTYNKIKELYNLINDLENTPDISVDGGVTTEISPIAIQNGATILVAGTAIFKSNSPEKIIEQLRTVPLSET